jgi:hypothetical protein
MRTTRSDCANASEKHSDSHNEHAHQPTGIEWENDMVDVNRMTNPSNMRWKLIDRQTGAEGEAIDWRFRVGEQMKLRIVNETDSDHPCERDSDVRGGAGSGRRDQGIVQPHHFEPAIRN